MTKKHKKYLLMLAVEDEHMSFFYERQMWLKIFAVISELESE